MWFWILMVAGVGAFLMYRAFYLCYVAGKSEDEAIKMILALHRRGYGVISDYLGEATEGKVQAVKASEIYLNHIVSLGNLKHLCPDIRLAVSIKLSQLGLLKDQTLSLSLAERLLLCAIYHDVEFEVDMEGRSTFDAMRNVVEKLAKVNPNFRVAIAANFSESKELLSYFLSLRIEKYRIVKGAYRGNVSDETEVETNFLKLVKMVADANKQVALATHNEVLAVKGKLIAPNAETHMLFGVRPFAPKHMVYMPWGNAWGKYFLRRAKEGIRTKVFILFLRNFLESLWWRYKHARPNPA